MDFITDNNPKFLNYAKAIIGDFPEYVKEASTHDRSDALSGVHSSSFAVPGKREFPLNTAENTYLSYAYVKAANLNDHKILGRLEKAINQHGITEDIEGINTSFSAIIKTASSDDVSKHFALSINYGDSAGVKYYYPVSDEQNIFKSASELSEDFDKMPLEAFRHAAKNIVKAASQSDVDVSRLPKRIQSNGIEREFNIKGAQVAINQRKEKLGNSAVEVYNEILKSASVDVENIDDYVNLFIDVDRVNHVKYGSHMLNPYEAFFSGYSVEGIKKLANTYVVVSNAPIPLSDFTKEARKAIEENFCSEDKESLLDIVKEAENYGGIAATEKMIQFPKELQKQFLGTLLGEK
jgi:hypothetical protein